ncbi:MAG: hypothetical protein JW797_08540 [Bradymonadales bacterium]|nr:hypothetical protein [Bradymonadales bacterium]
MRRIVEFIARHPWGWTWLYLALVVGGLLQFLGRRPTIQTETYAVAPPLPEDGEINLASLYRGGSVWVSSFDTHHLHHPLYAIDERANPTLLEKWATVQADREPWIEVRLARRADVHRVVLALAGAREDGVLTMIDYDIQCLREEQGEVWLVRDLAIHGNRESSPSHPLECSATDRVRIGFWVAPEGQPRDVVRLYEIQVLGEVVGDV